MTINWKDKLMHLDPFDIIRTAEILDTEEVNLNSKALELKNILDRKWETSALIFAVPKPAKQKPWWIPVLIGFACLVLWLLDSNVLLRNWKGID
jgi:hypothetical protein